MQGNILIVDDEEQLRKLLVRIIGLEGFVTAEADAINGALNVLKRKEIDVVLCDVKLSDGNGVDFVKTCKALYPDKEIILLTAFGNIPDGVQAIKNGAFDYITKGNENDRIIPLLYQAVEKVRSTRKSAVKVKDGGSLTFDDVLGESGLLKQAIDIARKIAPSDTNVLLTGETGTGKEVFANAIHSASKRASQRFVAINCSAITKDLLEGELFGHKTGAFTGATKDKKGLIELADNGTLFLDEIGEMPIELQAKLLRVVENGEFFKLGDEKKTNVNVRIISATNKNLLNEIASGTFREDLFYRLNVFSIYLPPLRDRLEDISLLAAHFVKTFGDREKKYNLKISSEVTALMKKHSWKGNIRELRNVIERAVILTNGNEIMPEHLPYEIQQRSSNISDSLSLASVERSHIQRVLEYTKGNKTKAAETLGIGLTTLYRKMEEYDIQK